MAPRSNAVLQFPIKAAPNIVNRKVPLRLKNTDYRSREYLDIAIARIERELAQPRLFTADAQPVPPEQAPLW